MLVPRLTGNETSLAANAVAHNSTDGNGHVWHAGVGKASQIFVNALFAAARKTLLRLLHGACHDLAIGKS